MRRAAPIVAFLISGSAGLIYQVCWIRKASLVFGSTTLAASTVIAVFFLGLAIGSDLFGRIATRVARPLRVFAWLEVAISALALLSLPAFDAADRIYSVAYGAVAHNLPLLFLLRFAVAALILLPPTILMGGTLPLFCRQFVVSRSRIAGSVGFLYGWNTLGAAVGCAAAGFWLLPAVGLQATVAIGAALSLSAGLSVLLFASRAPVVRAGAKAQPDEVAHRKGETAAVAARIRVVVLFAFFFTGFAAIGYEVLWIRYLGLLVRNTVHTYTLVLTVVLLGIVFGSLLAGWSFDRARSRGFSLGLLQVLTGLSVLGIMMLRPSVWQRLGDSPWSYLLLVLVPSVLSGAVFPLAVRMLTEIPSMASRTVGRLIAVNTAGGILGSFTVGFIGLPLLGLQWSVLLLTAMSLAIGAAAWLLLDGGARRRTRWALVAAGLVVWILLPRWSGTRVPADFLAGDGSLVAYREGLTSNLGVVLRSGVLQLEIDRLWQGENRKNHQALAAHIPMLLHPNPKRALVVGAGAGQTPSRFLLYDIEHLGCVDIEPAIFPLIRDHFESAWMLDPRVEIIRDDGRNFLAHSDARYDVISLEVGQIHRPGVAFFYTRDFYERAKERLEPGGLVSQFVPIPFFTLEQFQGVVRTFLSVFPESVLWYNTSELLLIGSNAALQPDPSRIARLLAGGAIAADLDYSHWGGTEFRLSRPEVFLAGFLMGTSGLERTAAGGAIYRDDRPVLDYGTRDAWTGRMREIPILTVLRSHLEPVSALVLEPLATTDPAEIEKIRERNLGDIVATLNVNHATGLIATGDRPRIISILTEAVRWNSENFEARRMLGEAYNLEKRPEDAVLHYVEAARIRPADPRVRKGLGTALLQLGRLEEAIASLYAAVELAPEDPPAHNNLGIALAYRGDLPGAVARFEHALALAPDYDEAAKNLAQARTAMAEGAARGGDRLP